MSISDCTGTAAEHQNCGATDDSTLSTGIPVHGYSLREYTANDYQRIIYPPAVYQDAPENVIGILHTKDFVLRYVEEDKLPALEQIMRPVIFVPQRITADRIHRMRSSTYIR